MSARYKARRSLGCSWQRRHNFCKGIGGVVCKIEVRASTSRTNGQTSKSWAILAKKSFSSELYSILATLQNQFFRPDYFLGSDGLWRSAKQ